ncbi:hypothetical protein RJ640_018692 [Escallonia rubra]|uniref:BHLH domain-containing protein n=1 Tax=Escallonia rubra TaxID=112253 RepID=A0AA88RUE7_9ASTE|nr:hypothetical protein RJ640_018692 [Escallonia rubra]
MLFTAEDEGLDPDGCFNYTSSFSTENPPNMLCFGGYQNESRDLNFDDGPTRTAQKSGVTCSTTTSSSASSTNKIKTNNRKRNVYESVQCLSSGGTVAPAGKPGNRKRTKPENSTVTVHAKVKVRSKEKLGDRISALQQLVSPFGKTDTASVLHEAMGYIRFLHDQVQVLCSPYLHRLPSSTTYLREGGENGGGKLGKDLRSRGLCLVPVDCTLHVASCNGADLWSPAAMVNNTPSQQH